MASYTVRRDLVSARGLTYARVHSGERLEEEWNCGRILTVLWRLRIKLSVHKVPTAYLLIDPVPRPL